MIRLRLLGGASLERDGTAIKGKASQRRRLAVLAILAVLRERSIGRERILALLWPEQNDEGGRRLLSEALYVLRKELGDETFRAAGDAVGVNPAQFSCDLWEFEEALSAGDLTRAVEAYGGPLLDGFFVSDAEGFEKWVDGERDRIQRSYLRALEQLALQCEAAEEFDAAAQWWLRLLTADQTSTRIALRAMHALEVVGDVGSAIRHAERHVEVLRDEIGAEPPPEFLRELTRLKRAPSSLALTLSTTPPSAPVVRTAATPAAPYHVGIPEEQASAIARITGNAPDAAVATLPVAQGTGAGWRRIGRVGRRPAAATISLLVLLGAGIAFAFGLVLRGAMEKDNQPLNPRRIAVLYFEDRSADKSLGHLTEGLTESLIHELGRVRGLHVVPRNGVRQYRSADIPLNSVAQTLDAGTLVTGSIQASSGRLRVMVEMLDGETLQHVQSKVLERPVGELFSLEDEIGSEVAGFLRQRLGEEIRVREGVAGTRNSRARDLFLQAERVRAMASETALEVHPLDTRGALGLLLAADSMLARAAEMDQQWEMPLISRGWIALQRTSLVPADSMSDWIREAERFANLALAVSNDRGPALELRGTARWRLVFLGRIGDKRVSDSTLAAAEADLQDAVSADPSLARGWSTLSQLLRLRGELASADVAAERALAEDEFIDEAPLIIERLYRSSFSLARYDKARAWCDRGHRQFPNDWRFLECGLTLMGYDEGATPSITAAWRLFDEMSQLDPPDKAIRSARPYSPIYRRMAVARVVARAGRADSARAMIARARASAANDGELRASLLYDEAYVRLLLGETKTAVALLEEYVRLKPHFRQYVAHDVQFRRLHGDPRFDALSPATTGTRP